MIFDQKKQSQKLSKRFSREILPILLISVLIILLVIDTYERYAISESGIDSHSIIGRQIPDSLFVNSANRIDVRVIVLYSETCNHCNASKLEWGEIMGSLPIQQQESILFISTTTGPAARDFLSPITTSHIKYQSNGKSFLKTLGVNQVPLYIRIDGEGFVRDISTFVKSLKRIVRYGNTS